MEKNKGEIGPEEKAVQEALEKAKRGELIGKNGQVMAPQSIQNLKPLNLGRIQKERAREIQRQGAAASNEKQARRRSLQEICQSIANLPIGDKLAADDQTAEIIQAILDDKESETQKGPQIGRKDGGKKSVTVYEAMGAAMAVQAAAGNVKAFVAFRDSAGDKPRDDVNINTGMTDGDRALLAKIEAKMGK